MPSFIRKVLISFIFLTVSFLLAFSPVVLASNLPNLTTNIYASSYSVAPGARVRLSIYGYNKGATSKSTTDLVVYFSKDKVLNAGDTKISTITVPILGAGKNFHNNSVYWTVPRTLSAGTYYLLAFIDARKAIAEANESDNSSFRTFTVDTKPDLQPQVTFSPNTPPKAGQKLSIQFRTYNRTGFPSRGFKTRLYFSTYYRFDKTRSTLLIEKQYANLAGSASVSDTYIYVVPASLDVSRSYFFHIIVDEDKQIDEKSETNNIYSRSFKVLSDKAELAVSLYSNTRTVIRGKPITINYRARNYGSVDAKGVTIRFYLSKDRSSTDSKHFLGKEVTIPLLEKGTYYPKSKNGTLTFTPSAKLPQGNYYLTAFIDPLNKIAEQQEKDNNGVLYFQVFTEYPDLSINYFAVRGSTTRGTNTTVSYRITNRAAIDSKPVKLRFYLSERQTSLVNPISLNKELIIPAIKAGQTTNISVIQILLPTQLQQGYKYLVGFIDADKTLQEGSEDNNVYGQSVYIRWGEADLNARMSPPRTLRGGQKFSIRTVISNSGAKPASSFSVHLYLISAASTPKVILLQSDTLSGIAKGGTITKTYTVVVPFGIPAGTGFLRMIVDKENKILENSEQNNISTYAVTLITLTQPKPDLRIISLRSEPNTSYFTAGSTIKITYIVASSYENAGPCKVAFYWSQSSTIGTQSTVIHTKTLPGLTAHRGLTNTFTYKLPSSLKSPSRYYIIGRVDVDNQIQELDENNNNTLKLIQIGNHSTGNLPDIQVPTFTASKTSLKAGDKITISYRLRNLRPFASGGFKVRFYASADATITNKDHYLGVEFTVPKLAANAYYPAAANGRFSWTVPAYLGGSTRPYIGILADYDNKVKESAESNNFKALRMYYPTQGATSPDLFARSLQIADRYQLKPSQKVKLNYSVYCSNADCGSSKVRFYWELNGELHKATYLNKEAIVSSLKKNTEFRSSVELTLPANLPYGFSNIIVLVDVDNQVKEKNELNQVNYNIKYSKNAPELIAEYLVVPDGSYQTGGKVKAEYRIKNSGGELDAQNVKVKFFLSKDRTITNKDIPLSTVVTIPEIKNNGHYPDPRIPGKVTLTLPTNLSGAYYIGMIVDPDNLIKEYSKTNNVRSGRLLIIEKPTASVDLLIAAMSSNKTSIQAGQAVELSYRILNTGTQKSGASKIRFYLSKAPVITTKDLYLGKENNVPALQPFTFSPNATGFTKVTVTIPKSSSNGNLYIGAYVDSSNTVQESSEQNNFFSLRLTVQGGTGPSNTAPKIVGTPPNSAFVGEEVTYAPKVTDADSKDTHIWKLLAGASNASIQATSGAFRWIPAEKDSGKAIAFTIQVCDSGSPKQCATQRFTLIPRMKCKSDSDCTHPVENSCSSGICVKKNAECREEGDCPANFMCLVGRCVPKKKEENNGEEVVTDSSSPDAGAVQDAAKGTDEGTAGDGGDSLEEEPMGCACHTGENNSGNPLTLMAFLILLAFLRRRFMKGRGQLDARNG